MLNVLNTRSSFQRSLLTAEDVLGPLDSLYDFGEMAAVYEPDPTLRPVALFGSDTSLLGSCPNFHDVTNLSWRGKTVGENSNLHVTVEASDPKSGLRWYWTLKKDNEIN